MSVRVVSRIVKTLSSFAMFVCLSLLLLQFAPMIESHWFPVAEKLQITSMTPTKDGTGTVLQVSFNKLRDCEYLGIAWYLKGDNGSVTRVAVITARPDSGSPNRPLGQVTTGPWTVDMPMVRLLSSSYAVLFHNCHTLWTTKTDFWP